MIQKKNLGFISSVFKGRERFLQRQRFTPKQLNPAASTLKSQNLRQTDPHPRDRAAELGRRHPPRKQANLHLFCHQTRNLGFRSTLFGVAQTSFQEWKRTISHSIVGKKNFF
jgi:hypothetical protein